eukprot:g2061.t1
MRPTPVPQAAMSGDERALLDACSKGDHSMVRTIIKKGVSLASCDYDRRTALHIASANGFAPIVRTLLSNKASNIDAFDRFNRTPLEDAIDGGHVDIAKMLRSRGATVKNPAVAVQLCEAAASGDIQKLQTLEASGGADMNCSDYDGRTALHLAACEGHLDIVKWLVGIGAKVAARDRFCNTPLDDAEREGRLEVAAFLRDVANVDADMM